MASVQFPLLVWPINHQYLMGQIVGTQYSLVDTDIVSLKRSAADYLNKAIKEGDIVEPPEIVSPVLKQYTVKVQLSYRDESKVFPLPTANRFTVAAVHGDSRQGYGQCFLPLFDRSFYYYDHAQLKALIEHFLRDFVETETPENALQHCMYSEPTLESIKVQMIDRQGSGYNTGLLIPEILNNIADRLPFEKKDKKAISRLPDVAWEQGVITDRLVKRLLDSKDNILLVGEQGVGKSSVWLDAIKIVTRLSKNSEYPLTFWRTTAKRLVSKAKFLGEWQEICDEVVDALAKVNGVLWVTDMANLIRTGGESQQDSVAAYLQSYVQKFQLRLIGEMRPQELESTRSLLPSFVHCFTPISLYEMNDKTAEKVLRHYEKYARQNLKIDVTDDALDLSYQLVNRYIKYEKSPGRHVRFFSECLKFSYQKKKNKITRSDIIQLFVNYTGLPEILLRDDISLSTDKMMAYFTNKIKGQDAILDTLCSVVQTFKSGLNDPDKPIATLLFAGQTGVGKTATAKALSAYFFSAGQKTNPLFTLDMSEFQHPGHIVRLIGDPSAPSKLVQHVRSNPFSVILFDEIEKAHPSVYDALLTVLDEGVLADNFGRVTDFRSSIIIMTTNLGSTTSKDFGYITQTQDNNEARNAIKKYFRPEFLNRIDYVLSFASLKKKHIQQITKRELEQIVDRDRIKENNIQLEFTDALVMYITDVGFSPKYGARPMRRAIEKYVIRAISDSLLNHNHGDKLIIDVDEHNLVFVRPA